MDDITRLRIEQMQEEIGEIKKALKQVGDNPRVTRTLDRIDGVEAEISAIRQVMERVGYYAHRHTDPLPGEPVDENDVKYFPPGCPEQCWRRCQCATITRGSNETDR
jgi:hypothetical protein